MLKVLFLAAAVLEGGMANTPTSTGASSASQSHVCVGTLNDASLVQSVGIPGPESSSGVPSESQTVRGTCFDPFPYKAQSLDFVADFIFPCKAFPAEEAAASSGLPTPSVPPTPSSSPVPSVSSTPAPPSPSPVKASATPTHNPRAFAAKEMVGIEIVDDATPSRSDESEEDRAFFEGRSKDRTSADGRSALTLADLVSGVRERVERRALRVAAKTRSERNARGEFHVLSASGNVPASSAPAASVGPGVAPPVTSPAQLCRMGMVTYEPTTVALAACPHLSGKPHCAIIGNENMEHEAGIGLCAVKDVLGGIGSKCFKTLQVLSCLIFDLNAQRLSYNETVDINPTHKITTQTFKVCENATCTMVDEFCAPGLCRMQLKNMCSTDVMCDVHKGEKCVAGHAVNFCLPTCTPGGPKCAHNAECTLHDEPKPLVNPYKPDFKFPETKLEKFDPPVALSPPPPPPPPSATPSSHPGTPDPVDHTGAVSVTPSVTPAPLDPEDKVANPPSTPAPSVPSGIFPGTSTGHTAPAKKSGGAASVLVSASLALLGVAIFFFTA